MKLHLPHLLRRAVLRALFAVSSVVTTLASASYADMITPDGRTATSVIQNGSVYNVYTNTVRGNTGFNSFSTFDVYSGTTANLYLPDGTGNLVNVVRDKCSYIDGVLNGYKDGKIGGNIFFLNPNGIVVSKSGVVNAGSISMSTPTAAFVEQLIARDGSISPTATKAVLNGDLPINEKGLISVKGKVNAAKKADFRAGRVEVSGEVHTGVDFKEMVNTGEEKVSSGEGMNISGGKISFGKKPAKSAKKAKKTATAKKSAKQKADIAIFADDVFMDGAVLDGKSVYIDPDKAEVSNLAITGEYTLEARVIILNNITVGEEGLTSFTLNAANELSDGTFEGNVSITLANCNIVADTVSLSASATTNAAEAAITIKSSDIKAALTSGDGMTLSAVSVTGNASVAVDSYSELTSAGDLTVGATSGLGKATVTMDAGSSLTADGSVTVVAGAYQGPALARIDSDITAKGDVTLEAATGWGESSTDESTGVVTTVAYGGGDASLSVGGSVSSEGNVTLAATAQGTEGDAALSVSGSVSALGSDTRTLGETALPRNESETVNDDDSEETVIAKNKAYLERYYAYLGTLKTGTGVTSAISVSASSDAGAASLAVSADKLEASYAIGLSATAATAAELQLTGKSIKAGIISAEALGETATLKVAEGTTLASAPHVGFTEDGSVESLSPSDGSVTLSARSTDTENDPENQVPTKKDGVLLEVAGTLLSRREEGSGSGGALSLSSDGDLTVKNTARLDAGSTVGAGGTITLDGFDYTLGDTNRYSVSGTTSSGTITVTNQQVLTLTGTLPSTLSESDLSRQCLSFIDSSLADRKEWKGSYGGIAFSGNVVLTGNLSLRGEKCYIVDNTHITGNGYSLTIENGPQVFKVDNNNNIGDNVTIDNVSSFSFKVDKTFSLVNMFGKTVITPNTRLIVGKNFKLTAQKDVTFSIKGLGNTYIDFGSGVSITAGGNVSITTTTTQGWGTTFTASRGGSGMDLLATMFGSSKNDFFKGLGSFAYGSGPVKVNTGGIVKDLLARFKQPGVVDVHAKDDEQKGKKKDGPLDKAPQIGISIAKSSITFADAPGVSNSITGSNVTIGSASTSKVSAIAKSKAGGLSTLSLGVVYNSCSVTLGNQMSIRATGEKGTITISSTTTSTNTLMNFSSGGASYGISLAFTYDNNELNIGKGSSLVAEKDIVINGTSTIKSEPMISLDRGINRELKNGVADAEAAYDPSVYTFMLDVLVHNNTVTIDGDLTANTGDITCNAKDAVTSTVSAGGSLSYTYSVKKETEKRKLSRDWFLLNVIQDNVTFNLGGLAEGSFKEKLHSTVDWSGFKTMFAKVSTLEEDLQNLDAKDQDKSICCSGAIDVTKSDTKLVLNGTADAKKGSVTLKTETNIEAGGEAENSILGVPSKNALAVSLSLPVIISSCTTEVGEQARIHAAKNITIDTVTTLPMSFDYLGWRAWKNLVEKPSFTDFIKASTSSIFAVKDGTTDGYLGLPGALSSTHASTIIEKTKASSDDSAAEGFSLVGDIRFLDTLTLINDGAELTAGETIDIDTKSTGTQLSLVGESPFAFTISNRKYGSTESAKSGFGASLLVEYKKTNTVTYVGAAKLTAGSLQIDSNADILAIVAGLAGSASSGATTAANGGFNFLVENKMTVSEVSDGATITLSSGASHVKATDESLLLNITGMEADGSSNAVGVGIAATLGYAYTAALLGNTADAGDYASAWNSLASGHNMPYARSGSALTLNLNGASELVVSALNDSNIYNIGISGAIGTGDEANAFGAANVGIIYNDVDTRARQESVTVSGADGTTVTTSANNDQFIVSVAGDVSVNKGSSQATVVGAGALSINRGTMNTNAEVIDSSYKTGKAFTIDAKNTAAIYAIDVACSVGSAKYAFAAGSAWNSLTGNTTAELIGGSVTSSALTVNALTDMNSLSVTLGAAVNLQSAEVQANLQNADQSVRSSLADIDNGVVDGDNNLNIGDNRLSLGERGEDDGSADGSMILDEAPTTALTFSIGASLARNAVEMHTKALLEGSSVTTAGALEVTARDESVITAIGVGAGIATEAGTIAAGGVFSFAPVNSTTEAIIRQSTGVSSPLTLTAGSLKLHAEDKHRERVWSFGLGGGKSDAGVGLVLSWGSFAGSSTKALLENAKVTVTGAGRTSDTTDVDILATSDLDATYISVGASGAEKAGITGMVNYLNFNNSVSANVTGSSITVNPSAGAVKVLSQSSRTFTDGVGALALASGGSSVGVALTFVYLGGNGEKDTCNTTTTVQNSDFANSGKTEILAKGTTSGTMAGINASAAGGTGAAVAGTFAWLTDYSVTATDVLNTNFNKRNAAADKAATITIDATSTSDLIGGFGTLGAKLGTGAGIGFSSLILQDHATTRATMTGGAVTAAKDLTVHASGKADLQGLLMGAAGSGSVAISGAVMSGKIVHDVDAKLDNAALTLGGDLTVKAENTANIGKKGTRFTVANGALGAEGGGIGIAFSVIDIHDDVLANANNLCSTSGTLQVQAEENNYANAITVNIGAGNMAGGTLDVGLPTLNGHASATLTSDSSAANTVGITTTGNADVAAVNKQELHSVVFTLAGGVQGGAVNLNVNLMHLIGSTSAGIEGNMPLTIGGQLRVNAATTRTGSYSTVALAVASAAVIFDLNQLSVSNTDKPDQTGSTEEEKKQREETANKGYESADAELAGASNILTQLDIDTDCSGESDATPMLLNGGSAVSFSLAASQKDTTFSTPETLVHIDLKGNTATVGTLSLGATDTITTTPLVVGVTGSLYCSVGIHIVTTDVQAKTGISIENSTIRAQKGISVQAKQTDKDTYVSGQASIGAFAGAYSYYKWKDSSDTYVNVGNLTKLSSVSGDTAIGSTSDISEDFTQLTATGVIGAVVLATPSFNPDITTSLSVADGDALTAGSGSLTLSTDGNLTLNATLTDVGVAIVTASDVEEAYTLKDTQNLTIGNSVTLSGASVALRQLLKHNIDITLTHVGAGVAFSNPGINLNDTVTSALTLGDNVSITATAGDISVQSDEEIERKLYLYGATFAAGASTISNSSALTHKNSIRTGKNTKLTATGSVSLTALSKDTSSLHTTNTTGAIVSLTDLSLTTDTTEQTTELTIGDGAAINAKALTLRAENISVQKHISPKVSISLVINPYSKTQGDNKITQTATVTMTGGAVDVQDFTAQALNDASVDQSAIIGGGSVIYDNNRGTVTADTKQTAAVNLGTEANKLTIRTDNTDADANNKYRYASSDADGNVHGTGVGIIVDSTIGHAETTLNMNAAVTLGKQASITRHADMDHFLKRSDYHTHLAATNDADSSLVVDLASGGILSISGATTSAVTTAAAKLNVLGSIDAWADTVLTAYSHVRQRESNTSGGGGIPIHYSDIVNTVDVTDELSISGSISTIGNLTLNAGSAGGELRLADGTTVTPGTDDCVTTMSEHGKDGATQRNKRTDKLTVSGTVRAGGTIGIYNNPAANTSATDEKDAVRLISSVDVTSVASLTGQLTSGLNSYLSVYFSGLGEAATATYTTAMNLFEGCTDNGNGTYSFTASNGLFVSSDSQLYVNALSIGGSGITIVTKDAALTEEVLKAHTATVADHSIDIFFDSSCAGQVIMNGLSITDTTEGLRLNGKQVADPTTVSLPKLYRSNGVSIRSEAQGSAGKLTLAGTYSMPKSTLYVRNEGSLIATGTFNCGNVDFVSKGDFTMKADKSYSVTSVGLLYDKLFNQYADQERAHRQTADTYVYDKSKPAGVNGTYYNNDSQYPIFDTSTYTQSFTTDQLIAAEDTASMGSITVSGSITITGSDDSVIDLNGHLNAGVYQVNIPKEVVLEGSDNTTLTIAQADALYKKDNAQREFRLDGNDSINAYYDAATKRIVITGICDSGDTKNVGVFIKGNIVNTDASGTADIKIATGYRDLTIDNQSSYDVELGNIELSSYREAQLVLDNTYTGQKQTFTRASLGSDSGTVDLNNGSMKAVISRKTVTDVTEEGRLTFSGSLNSSPLNRTGSYSELFGTKTPMVGSLKLNTKGATTDANYTVSYTDGGSAVNSFVTTYETGKMTCTAYSKNSAFYRSTYTLSYQETKTDTMTISANNGLKLSFVGNETGSSLTVNSGNVYVSGLVTADIETVNATGSVSSGANGLLQAEQLKLTAGGSIGSVADSVLVNSTAVNHAEAAVSSSFTAGDSLYIDAIGSLVGTHFKAGATAQLVAESDIATDGVQANSAKTTVIRSASGSITLTDGTAKGSFTPGVLTAEAEDNVSIRTANVLVLDCVVSREMDVTIAAAGGISAYNLLDTTAFETSYGANAGTSLRDLTSAAVTSYRETYNECLNELTQMYYEKDDAGKYTNRDANGNLWLSTADSEITQLTTALAQAYEMGYGEQIAALIYDCSGTDAVGGTKFSSKTEAGAYLALHRDEVLGAFAKQHYKALMTDLTNAIRRNSNAQVTVDYGKFNEAVYRLYWQEDANGKLVNQSANGTFISPTITKEDGSVVTLYSEETCAAITKQFRGSARAANYVTSTSDTLLRTLAAQMSGYTELSDVLSRAAGELGTLAQGIAVNGLPTTISAAKGKITLTTDGTVGSQAFTFALSPESTDANGKPVYNEWAQSFINEVAQNRRNGTKLVSYDATTGVRTYSVSKEVMTLNTMNELDLLLLKQAAADDVSVVSGTWTVGTRGYLGIEAQTLSVNAKNAYLSAEGDLSLSDINASELRVSTTGSISGGTVNVTKQLVLHAGDDIGSADNYLTLNGSPKLSLTTEDSKDLAAGMLGETPEEADSAGNIYLASAQTVKLSNLRGNVVDIRLSGAAKLMPVEGSAISGAQVECKQLNLYAPAAAFDIGNAQKLGLRTTGSSAATGGLHLYADGGVTTLDTVSLYAAASAYPFYLCTENGINTISALNAAYSGVFRLANDLTIGTATFTQNNASVKINEVGSDCTLTFTKGVTFSGAADYTANFSGAVTQGSGSTFTTDGKATLTFGQLSAEDGSVNIVSSGNLSLSKLAAVAADLEVQADDEISLVGVSTDGKLNVISRNGDIDLLTVDAAEGITLNAGSRVMGVLTFAPTLDVSARMGGIYLNSTDAENITASANKAILIHTMSAGGTETVSYGKVSSANGFVKLLSEMPVTHLTDRLSGTYIYLYSSGTFEEDPGYQAVSEYNMLVREEGADIAKLVFDNLKEDLSDTLDYAYDSVSGSASDAEEAMRNKQKQVTEEPPTKAKSGVIYFDASGKPLPAATDYAKQFTKN